VTADDRRLIERVYLEYREGSSSKFYAVVRTGHADGSQSVSFNFGRIGAPRAWDDRARRVTPTAAAAAYASLVGEKRHKGYRDAPWPDSLAGPDGGADPLAPPFVAAASGVLPDVGAVVVAGIALPIGRPIAPGIADDPSAAPGLWLTDEPLPDVGDLWARLAAVFPATGLWPLVVDNPDLADVLGDPRSVAEGPAGEILQAAWDGNLADDDDEGEGELSPYSRGFPGSAAPTTGASDAGVFAAVARRLEGHLGLVPVLRPADAVTVMGWQGWANYDADPGDMAAVFRSWEERFGAVLVGLGFDVLTFAVSRPARNLAEATAIAAEHTAVCPDNIWQGAGTLRDYARDLAHAQAWSFWWD
jgi:predicted DNA-binding WGR domain protein